MSPRRESSDHGPIEVVWEAPPAPISTQMAEYLAALEQVKAQPGKWARIRVFATGNAYTVGKRLREMLPENRWEIDVVRSPGPPESWALYARYRTNEQMEAAKVGRNGP